MTQQVFVGLQHITTELAKLGIGKDSTNTGQGFNYRSVDQVLNTLAGLMVEAKLVFSHEVVHSERREVASKSGAAQLVTFLRVRTTITSTADGSSYVLGVYEGEGMDNRDKSTSKAHSMAFKYAAFLGFCIPLEGVLDDSDADSPAERAAGPQKPAAPKSVPKPAQEPKAAQEPAAAPEPTPTGGAAAAALKDIAAAAGDKAALQALRKTLGSVKGLTNDPGFPAVKEALLNALNACA